MSQGDAWREHFDVKPVDIQNEVGAEWLDLLPKDEGAQFQRLRLAMVDNSLWRMELLDNFGQITYFTFTKMQRNPPLDTNLFVFEPPSGVDLIGDL
jgi:outer membrane lipoprotein carrier protein